MLNFEALNFEALNFEALDIVPVRPEGRGTVAEFERAADEAARGRGWRGGRWPETRRRARGAAGGDAAGGDDRLPRGVLLDGLLSGDAEIGQQGEMGLEFRLFHAPGGEPLLVRCGGREHDDE